MPVKDGPWTNEPPPIAVGHKNYRVEMWYRDARIGVALVVRCHSAATAKRVALRGIATVITPMRDADHAVWLAEQAFLQRQKDVTT